MRLEVELSDGGGGGRAPDLPPIRLKPQRRELDRFELSVIVAFTAVSVFVLALDLWRVAFDGAVWTFYDGVMTQPYLGCAVPGKTGRRTYVDDCLWSELNCWGLTHNTQALFGGRVGPAAARRVVVSSKVRFVLADRSTTADMRKLFSPIIRAVHNFGCSVVYEVD